MANLNNLIVTGTSRFLNKINGNISGTSSNVTGTVALNHGGTGATTRLAAAKVLTDEPVVTPGFVVGLTDNWGKFGYTSIANLKTTLGSMTPSSHTHGNIQNGGTLQSSDITIANGDKLVVTDSSDSSKIARTSISFDGSTTTQCLTKKGTWATFGTSNLTIGTTASTAMAGNTNVNNVTQTAVTSGTYKLLVSGQNDTTTRSEGANKCSNITVTATGQIDITSSNGSAIWGTNNLKLSSTASNTLVQVQHLNSNKAIDKYCNVSYSDIDLSSTWDGTNTSLVTALTNKISKETNTTVSWTSTATGRTVVCMLAKIGTIVICTITGSTDANHSITAWTATQLGAGQIPAGYRPSSATEGRIPTQTGGAVVTVNTVGTVAITTWSNLGGQMAFGGTLWWKTS